MGKNIIKSIWKSFRTQRERIRLLLKILKLGLWEILELGIIYMYILLVCGEKAIFSTFFHCMNDE